MDGIINVYGCGGTGINFLEKLVRSGFKEAVGYAKLNLFAVDLSDNSKELIDELNDLREPERQITPIFIGKEGGGSDRRVNVPLIISRIGHVLQQAPIKQFNIVLYSATGASGSTTGPILIKELLSLGHNIITICLGSDKNLKETQNTVGTLRTLATMSDQLQLPIPVIFIDRLHKKRSEVETQVLNTVMSLSNLFGDGHLENDASNLESWLRYNRVTDYDPSICNVQITAEVFDMQLKRQEGLTKTICGETLGVLPPISRIVLKDRRLTDVEGESAPYERLAFLVEPRSEKNLYAISYTINQGDFAELIDRYEERSVAYQKEADLHNSKRRSLVSKDTDDSGLVF